MTTTSLAYINAATSKSVELLEQKALQLINTEREMAVRPAPRPVVVSGFTVLDKETPSQEVSKEQDEAWQKRLAAFKEYRRDRRDLSEELKRHGITALTILPKAAFERICLRSGLFLLYPTSDGQIIMSDVHVRRAHAQATKQVLRAFSGVIYTLPVAATVMMLMVMHTTKEALVWPILVCIIALFMLNSLKETTTQSIMKMVAARRLRREAQVERPWEELLRELMPDGTSLYRNSEGVQVKIRLPDPPQEVGDILLKMRKGHLPLCVAAEASAIQFAEDPTELFIGRLDIIARPNADPIIFTSDGSATAVIAQFGDFPIEKHVVDEVLASDFLV